MNAQSMLLVFVAASVSSCVTELKHVGACRMTADEQGSGHWLVLLDRAPQQGGYQSGQEFTARYKATVTFETQQGTQQHFQTESHLGPLQTRAPISIPSNLLGATDGQIVQVKVDSCEAFL